MGIPILDVTMDEAVDAIEWLVDDGRRTDRTHQVATVNADFLANALSDDLLMHILRRSTCLADGAPLKWLPTMLGTPVRERVAGADLLPQLVARSEVTGWSIHVFGSAPDTSARAEALLRERYPRAQITTESGPMIDDPANVADEVIEGLAARNADIVCVALGNPKQEYFIHRHASRIGSPVMIGIGGSLDMLVGDRRRASRRVQALGLEWIARAAQEPRRLGPRYARDIRRLLPSVLREVLAAVRHGRHGELTFAYDPEYPSQQPGDVGTPRPTYADAARALLLGDRLEIAHGQHAGHDRCTTAQIAGLTRLAEIGRSELRMADCCSRDRASTPVGRRSPLKPPPGGLMLR